VADVRAEQRAESVRRIQRPAGGQRRGTAPDLVVVVAHTPRRGGPLGVVAGQGGEQEALLDHEVMLALAIPEVEEALDGLVERRRGRPPQAQGDLERVMVITRERREFWRTLHRSPFNVLA
jgi:hypothetical protein